jgi:DNA-binding NarL/FixJ family response regulator
MAERARKPRPSSDDGILAAPSGLSAGRLRIGGDDFAVLEWPLDAVCPRTGLTPAEQEILEAISAGLSNRDIARRRGTSERTVANQVAHLLRKLGAGSRHELLARTARRQRR